MTSIDIPDVKYRMQFISSAHKLCKLSAGRVKLCVDLPIMVGTRLVPLPRTTMVRMKYVAKMGSWLRGGRGGTDSVLPVPSKGRRVKSPSFPY